MEKVWWQLKKYFDEYFDAQTLLLYSCTVAIFTLFYLYTPLEFFLQF